MKPLTILIADDEPDDLEFLTFLFNSNESFEIVGSLSSGKQVLEEILGKRNIPDILLIDRYMPEITGIEVVELLLEAGTMPNLFIFLISSTVHSPTQQKYQDHPRVNFLLKPSNLIEKNDLPGLLLDSMNFENHNKI